MEPASGASRSRGSSAPRFDDRPASPFPSTRAELSCRFSSGSRTSARNALVVVLGSEAHQKFQRFRKRLRPLHRAVRHVGGGLTLAVHRLHVGALRNEVQNHLDVASGGGVVEGGSALVVAGVHVGPTLLDQVLDGGGGSRGG